MKAFNTANSIIWSRHDISIYQDSDDIKVHRFICRIDDRG